jgi:hypothetical protein
MLSWWISWYYDLPYFTNEPTPSKNLPGHHFKNLQRTFHGASQKFQQRLLSARQDVLLVDSTDSDYVDEIES